MARIKLIAILICIITAPAFGQTEAEKKFSVLNETTIAMQLRLESPDGVSYDRIQRLPLGKEQQFTLQNGWNARVDFLDPQHRPEWLHVENNSTFTVMMKRRVPVVKRTIGDQAANNQAAAEKILKIIKREPSSRINVHNDSSMGMWLKMDCSGNNSDKVWIPVGKSRKFRLQPDTKIKAIFQGGKQLSVDLIDDATTYRFFQNNIGFMVDKSVFDMPSRQRLHGNEMERALGVSLNLIGDQLWRITNIEPNSVAGRLRLQIGDTITDHHFGDSDIDSSDQPKPGLLLKAVGFVTKDGIRLVAELPSDLGNIWLSD